MGSRHVGIDDRLEQGATGEVDMTLLELSLEVDRRLNRLGWDRTVNGWEHSKTREVASMESALRMEAMKEEREKAGEGE
jgi:hypothetical protein